MSTLYDAVAYNRRPAPVMPEPADAMLALASEAAGLRQQLAFALRALRHTRDGYVALMTSTGLAPDMRASRTALADAALEQGEAAS